jgi:hypothetical protein
LFFWLILRNIRNEINAAELHAVFLPFGAIVFCNFIGQESAYPSATGPVVVRSALIEYRQPSSTAECITNMNAFSLGGVHLLLDAVDATMATALKGPLSHPDCLIESYLLLSYLIFSYLIISSTTFSLPVLTTRNIIMLNINSFSHRIIANSGDT